MNGEKVIDLLWEVKEGKKHPNKAYTELCALFGAADILMGCEICGEQNPDIKGCSICRQEGC